jgi:flagellar basal-body rod protein FlgG
MSNSLFIAATGMNAEQAQIDTVANNLVNMNTMGFKKSRVAFSTLMPEPLDAQGLVNAQTHTQSGNGAAPSYLGMGVSGTNALLDFATGTLKQTQSELDFAVQGHGLFEVQLPDGSFAYTRNGSLHVNNDGYLVNVDGYPLSAMVQIPSDMEKITVSADGRIQVKNPDSDQLIDVGNLQLAHFANEAGLKPIGNNLYIANETTGDVLYSHPGENGAGTISQGYLEASNVQMIEELTNMMTAQRAYEANSKVLQASDEIQGIINNLRK